MVGFGLPRAVRTIVSCAVLVAAILSLGAASPIAAGQAAIPFVSATVSRGAERGGRYAYIVAWRAPGVRRVRVYASRAGSAEAAGAARAAVASGTAALTISGPGAAPVQFFTLVPDHGAALTIADRSLHLAGAANFRDVGGWRTGTGAWVRMGLAYRSNELDRLTTVDLGVLQGLGLHLVCDLRTVAEQERGADMLPPGVPRISSDVLADDGPKLRALMGPRRPGQAATPMPEATDVYRDFVSLPSARAAYHSLFMALSDRANLPMVFHCSAGKDRSGWAAAVLLTILGVPRATVTSDYMLTEHYLRGDNLDHLRTQYNAGSTAAAALGTDEADLDAAFDEVSRTYRTFAVYLRDGLGLTDAVLTRIRQNFLVGDG